MGTDNLHPVKNYGKATPVVNSQCMCYASDEIKKYEIALFLIYDEKGFVYGNDDDNYDYSDNDNDVKNVTIYMIFKRNMS